MMVLQKNRGMSSYLEVTDIDMPYNFEGPMVMNNKFRFIPPIEINELDGDKSVCVKVDGLGTLLTKYGRCMPNASDVRKLVSDIRNCILELREYLLNPDSLVLDINYILFDSEKKEHRFIYVPGNRMNFRQQIKKLFEEIMRLFDHKDKNGVVYLYDLYSCFLGDNFTPEIFCSLPLVNEEEKNMDAAFEDVMELDVEPDFLEEEIQGNRGINTREEKTINKSLYLLASVAVLVVSIVLFIFFGKGSIRFSSLMVVALLVFIITDVLSTRKKIEDKEPVTPLKSEVSLESIETAVDTTILSSTMTSDNISKLVPYKRNDMDEIVLVEGETKIGRQKDVCDYYVGDPSVSRLHAIFEKRGNVVLVRDANSTNGTYVNDKRVNGVEGLEAFPGDIVSIAGVQYECC